MSVVNPDDPATTDQVIVTFDLPFDATTWDPSLLVIGGVAADTIDAPIGLTVRLSVGGPNVWDTGDAWAVTGLWAGTSTPAAGVVTG